MRLLRRALALTIAVTAGSASCASEQAPPAAEKATLPAGVAAQVGRDPVHSETIRRIVAAEGVDVDAARDRAVSDALFALGAREALPPSLITSVERAAYARALLEELERRARAQPIGDDEIARIAAERWPEFDRPEAARTTHAVVISKEPKARKVANAIAAAVEGVSDPEKFIERANAVPKEGLDVRVERLSAVTADGRTIGPNDTSDPNERYDLDFARAALAIAAAGQHSPVVETKFGFHVILLEERLPAKVVPLEERRKLLSGEVRRRRAEALRRELVARLSGATAIERSRSLEELTAKVPVAP
ncbi:MAG: peptidyl-prolyl cis-trans isomerase [Gammaproteobacteria bacterium]